VLRESKRSLNYEEFSRLIDFGVRKGDAVSVYLPNCSDMCCVYVLVVLEQPARERSLRQSIPRSKTLEVKAIVERAKGRR
jgi:hypothetical protein